MLCRSYVSWSFGIKVGKWDNICIAIDIHLNDFDKFNLGFLLMLCQKDLQEDGWGGEGGMACNIGGELGSIPTYPAFIPTGPKKLFCRGMRVVFL